MKNHHMRVVDILKAGQLLELNTDDREESKLGTTLSSSCQQLLNKYAINFNRHPLAKTIVSVTIVIYTNPS